MTSLVDLPLWTLLIVVFILSAIVGSFLNVVIYRLPIMMENDYKSQAREILELEEKPKEKFNLIFPRSKCRNCNHMIGALENIPVFSYIFMLGKCRGCSVSISPFYPIVELITGLLAVWVVLHFGYTYQGLFAMFFVWFLVSLTGIDMKVQLLPDIMTISLMWLGIILSFWNTYISLEMAVIGALVGYLSLWTVATVFKLLTGRDGMGLGDAKLLAAIFTWVHISYLPVMLLMACVAGIVVAIIQKILKGNEIFNQPIPFGPYLAAAGFLALLYGKEILYWYTGILSI